MSFIGLDEIEAIHRAGIDLAGGSHGLRDRVALESAIAQPLQSFAGADLYPGIVRKCAVLAFGIASNHPFIDGNKRCAYLALETVLGQHGFEMNTTVDEAEDMMIKLASGVVSSAIFIHWVEMRVAALAD